jgi:hypothetical protein
MVQLRDPLKRIETRMPQSGSEGDVNLLGVVFYQARILYGTRA